MSTSVANPVPVDDAVAPPLEPVNESLPQAKHVVQHAKAMKKMGLISVPNIRKIRVRHHGSNGFEVNNSQVFRFPDTDTFVVFGEVRELGKVGLSLSESAALAVTEAGIGEIFESMASSRSLPEKFLHSDASTSASVTPERESVRSSSRSVEMLSSAGTPQRNVFSTRGGAAAAGPLGKASPQRKDGARSQSDPGHSSKNSQNKGNQRQKSQSAKRKQQRQNAVDDKNKKKPSKSQSVPAGGQKAKNAQDSAQRRNKSTNLREQRRSLAAARNAFVKLCKHRKMGHANGNDVSYLKRTGELGDPESVDDGFPDDVGSDLCSRDVRVVMNLSGATHGTAVRSLRKNGTIMDAVYDLILD